MSRPFLPQERIALSQAIGLHQRGQFDQALAVYRQLLAVQPENAEVLRLAGTVLSQTDRFEEGAALLGRSAGLQANPDTFHCLGNALVGMGHLEDAAQAYGQVLALQPDNPDALTARGNVQVDLKRLSQAFADFDRALALVPGHLDAQLGRAIALEAQKRFEDAMEGFKRVLAVDPLDAVALHHLGDILFLFNNFEAALDCYLRALKAQPDIEWLPGHALYLQMHLSDWSGFRQGRDWLAQRVRAGAKVTAPLPLHALIDDPEVQQQAAQRFAPAALSDPLPAYSGHERIRIGYVSSDFKNHPVSHLVARLLERHDRSRFEVFAFSLRDQAEDEWRTRIRQAADHFIQLADLSDADTVQAMRDLEIDIAVDLNGYTYGGRTGVFARRAAPVQVSWLGFLGTMGSGYIDYLLADEVIIPKESQRFYNETVAYLPSFQINDDTQGASDRVFSRAELGLPESGFVFCSFNQAYKLTPDVFDSWMRILDQVPDSVLWLLATQETAATHLRAEARQRGVAAERLVFAGRVGLGDHLARMKAADLFLDSHPYNAGATASNALRMGLPVLTRIGKSFAARMGASLLTAVGMPELITETVEDYEALAVRLATRPEDMAKVKQKLANNLPGSLLFDTERATRALEAAFADMVRTS